VIADPSEVFDVKYIWGVESTECLIEQVGGALLDWRPIITFFIFPWFPRVLWRHLRICLMLEKS
jgi:hypothetical protein